MKKTYCDMLRVALSAGVVESSRNSSWMQSHAFETHPIGSSWDSKSYTSPFEIPQSVVAKVFELKTNFIGFVSNERQLICNTMLDGS